jgi:hypothetical protein
MARCPNCDAELPTDDVDESLGLARCFDCDGVFRLEVAPHSLERDVSDVDPSGLPEGLTFDNGEGSNARLVRRWSASGGWVSTLVFGCIFACVSIYCYLDAFYEGRGLRLGTFGIAAIAGLLALLNLYTGIKRLLNRTYFEIDDGVLTITHRPFWWWQKQTIELSRLHQLYCTEIETGEMNTDYLLRAVLDGREETRLLQMRDESHARGIERALEEALGIDDQPVAGEL